jgi:hypothetical protein
VGEEMGEREYQEILYEIRERVTRLETKLDNIQDVKAKAYEAHRMSTENQKSIEKIENKFIRMTAAVWTLFVGALLAILNYFLRGGN